MQYYTYVNHIYIYIYIYIYTDKKTEIMRKRKMLKGSAVFLNDHLTQKNNELFAEARWLKKEWKIVGTWTMNGNIFVKKTCLVLQILQTLCFVNIVLWTLVFYYPVSGSANPENFSMLIYAVLSHLIYDG